MVLLLMKRHLPPEGFAHYKPTLIDIIKALKLSVSALLLYLMAILLPLPSVLRNGTTMPALATRLS